MGTSRASPRHRNGSLPSNRRSFRSFHSAIVFFILLSFLVILQYEYPSEVFSQIDADLRKIQGGWEHTEDNRDDEMESASEDLPEADVEDAEEYVKNKDFDSDFDYYAIDQAKISSKKSGKSEEDMYFRDYNAPVADWHYYPPLKQNPRRDPSWEQAEQLKSELLQMTTDDCDAFMQNIDASPPPLREPTNEACNGYDGVFQIQHFDAGGASGASFFMFTVGMLAWADQHNYLPWIHIEDNHTKPIWDPIVHTNVTKITKFTMMEGMEIGWARDPDDTRAHIFPGKPYVNEQLRPFEFVLNETGVWEHYFLPVNDFVPGDSSCRDKPLVKMNEDHTVPGMHANAPWAPRAWRYAEADYIQRWDLTWDQWFRPQRRRGSQMTERYIRFNPMIERRAHCSFPNPEMSLGMHIRHGDKGVERQVISIDEFFPFAKIFLDHGGKSIYLATDSTEVVKSIKEGWPKNIADRVHYQVSAMGRSSNTTAAFDIGVSHHRTNVEAMTDVLALSKCTFFLHGISAMSEAVFYLNPGLVSRSVDLEFTSEEMRNDDERLRPIYFLNKIMKPWKENMKKRTK